MNYSTPKTNGLITSAALTVPLLLLIASSSATWASGGKTKHAPVPPPVKAAKTVPAKKTVTAAAHKPAKKVAHTKTTLHAKTTTHAKTTHRGGSRAAAAASAARTRSAHALVQVVPADPVAPPLRIVPPYQKTMPRGSYLVKPARQDNAAYQQAITRPMILKRYQYAWKTSPEETLRRLKGLHLTRLQQPGVYRVYYARANGAWGYKVRHVPVGTLVFTLPDTPRPLMLQVCGNPVEEVLPPRNAHERGMVPPFSPSESEAGLVLEDLGDTGDLYAFSPQTPDFLGGQDILSGGSGNLLPIPSVAADVLDTSGGATFPIPLGGGGGGGGFLFPILATAIGSQIIHSSGGSTNGGTTSGSTTSGSTTNGSTTNGSTTNGSTTNGSTTNGSTTNGFTTNGTNGSTNGSSTNTGITEVPEPSGGVVTVAILGMLGLALAWPTLASRRRKA